MATDLDRQYLIVARDMAKSDVAETCIRFGMNAETCEKLVKSSLSDIANLPSKNVKFSPSFDAKMLDRLVATKDAGTRSAMVLVNRHGARL